MDIQEFYRLPATKGDIERVLERLEALRVQAVSDQQVPKNPIVVNLDKRLAHIEKITMMAVGLGFNDLPVNAETASAITGNTVSTIRKYGAHRAIDTIKIGRKLQFSLRGCIALVNAGSRKALIDCTSEMNRYHRKKQKT